MNETSKFWDYLSQRLELEAPLYNWRTMFGGELDFEKFRKTFLFPADGTAESVMCPKPCGRECPRRVIRQYHDKGYEAVCRKRENDYFPIAEEDILIYKLQESSLARAVAGAPGIPFGANPFQTFGRAWRLREFQTAHGSIPVFITFLRWEHEMLDLILNLNRLEDGPYLLLGLNRRLLKISSEQQLADQRAKYIPLNETLDFNREAELTLMRPLDLGALFSPLSEAQEEPENIFRKCGEVWEVRFAGGEKFMLNSADTGATYLHFMLSVPNTMTPIVKIMRGASVESGNYATDQRLGDDDLLAGYSLSDLPLIASDTITDEKALRQYHHEMQLLIREIDCARENGDNTTVEQLQQDLENLNKGINETVSPAGQKKKFADQMRKLVDAFRKSINFAIEKIAVHDPSLAEHFYRTVRGGQMPGYFPADGVNWEL